MIGYFFDTTGIPPTVNARWRWAAVRVSFGRGLRVADTVGDGVADVRTAEADGEPDAEAAGFADGVADPEGVGPAAVETLPPGAGATAGVVAAQPANTIAAAVTAARGKRTRTRYSARPASSPARPNARAGVGAEADARRQIGEIASVGREDPAAP